MSRQSEKPNNVRSPFGLPIAASRIPWLDDVLGNVKLFARFESRTRPEKRERTRRVPLV